MNGADGLAIYQWGCIEYVIALLCLFAICWLVARVFDLFD